MKKYALLVLLMILPILASAEGFVVWCESNTTLYFLNSTTKLKAGDTHNGQTITNAWTVTDVEKIPINDYSAVVHPAWHSINPMVTKVEFEESFKDVSVNSTWEWFNDANNLTTITGLKYLNTSNVEDMVYMFSDCSSLTSLDLSHFDTSKVKEMGHMFDGCSGLTSINLTSFDTSNVESMGYVFNKCESLKALDLSSFDTSKVTYMGSMFSGCGNLKVIYIGEKWNTSNVTFSWQMFRNCYSLIGQEGTNYNEDKTDANYAHANAGGYMTLAGLPSGVTAQVVWCEDNHTLYFLSNTEELRAGNTHDGQTITMAWDITETAKCTIIEKGEGRRVESVEVRPSWNLMRSKVTNAVFEESFKDVSVTNTRKWFSEFTRLQSIIGFEYLNTSNVEDMTCMFNACSSLSSLNLSNFNTNMVEHMDSMFCGCSNLTTIYVSDKWSTSNTDSSKDMFLNCSSLIGQDGTTYNPNKTDATYAYAGDGGYMTLEGNAIGETAYAVWCESNTTLYFVSSSSELKKGDTYKGQTITNVWKGLEVAATPAYSSNNPSPAWVSTVQSTITNVVFDESFKDIYVTQTSSWFRDFKKLESITGLEYLNTNKVKGMALMFFSCSSLKSLDLSYFDTSEVTDMRSMFYQCSGLTSLDLSHFDTSNVTTMGAMFCECSGLKVLDLSHFDTRKVTDMGYMFYLDDLRTIYIGDKWDTSNVTSSTAMFWECIYIVGQDGTTYIRGQYDVARAHAGEGGYLTLKNESYKIPYAIWCEGNTTLYFLGSTNELNVGDTYNGQTITNVWSESDIKASPMFSGRTIRPDYPAWVKTVQSTVTNVVFDKSFEGIIVTQNSGWFYNFKKLESIIGLEYLNTSKVKSMGVMFNGCEELTSLDLTHFDTSNVTDIGSMFFNCNKLTSLDLSSFDTNKVTETQYMFCYCFDLRTIYIGDKWDMSNVEAGYGMFMSCVSIVGQDGTTYDSNDNSVSRAHANAGGYMTKKGEGQVIPVEAPNLVINTYPVFKEEFNGNSELTIGSTWSQFSRYIHADHQEIYMNFNEWYYADCIEGDTDVDPDNAMYVTPKAYLIKKGEYFGENGYQLKLYNFSNDIYGNDGTPPTSGYAQAETTPLGSAIYYPHGEGLTNHTFSWSLSKEEVEMLIKDKTGSVLVTRWICFAAKDSRMAPYPYIWVKLTIEITTAKAQQKFYYGIKNDNYWYHWNPNSNLNNSQVQNGWSALVFDVEAPRDGMTIKDQPWISRISNTLMENYVKIDGKSKYYFAPKVGIDVILPNGAYFYITPENESNHDTYNKLFSQNGEQFDWDEATLEDVLNNNSIIYGGEGAGVFNNDILYAVNISGREYIPIARLIQEQDLSQSKSSASTAGTLELIRYLPIGSTLEDVRAGRAQENTLLYDLLNAVGYPTRDPYKKDYSQCNFDYSMENMHWQLRAWLGYVKDDGNNVAQYVEQGKYDDNNKATFMVSWQRPINAFLLEPLYPVKTEEKYLYLIDHLMLYDWRGGKPNQGYMWDDHYWFWAYYNVKEIDVDLSPYHVKTNLHQEEGEWAYLNQVSTPIQLCPIETKNPGTPAAQVVPGSGDIGIYPFDLLDANMKFTYSYNNSALKKYMGDPNHANDFWQVTNYVQRARFGGIYYNRNGENAKSFSILVPVTVKYEWGSVTTDFQINIENESGSDDNEVITFTTSKGLTYEGNTKTQTATLIGVDSEKTGEVKVPEAVLKDDYSFIVTAIAANAFDGCTQIEKVELPKSIEDFAAGALSGCTSLQEIRIIDGGGRFCTVDGVLFSIGNDVLMAYPAAKGTKYEIPTTVTTILDGSFAHAQLTTLTVGWYNPDAIAVDVAAFEGVDFENCELSVPLGMSADYRQHKVWGLFMNVTGKETVIVDGVKYNIKEDGTASFEGPADKSVAGDYVIESPVIFNGVEVPVTEIGDGAFEDCTELTSITIPSTVESIGENAFKGCKNLEEIYCESGVPIDLRKTKRVRTRTGEIITQFDGIDFDKCILYVPIGSKTAYENAEGWNQFKHIVEYDPTSIRDIRQSSNGQDVYYNLQGQRVTNPTKGLYIKNGQKVVVK